MDLFCSGGHSQWGTARTCAEWHFRRAAGIALERNPAERIYLSDHVVPVSADGAFSKKDCFKTGLLWMFMTVLFEFASGLAQGCAFAELLAAYNPATGNLWILVMLSTLLSPVIAGMKKGRKAGV